MQDNKALLEKIFSMLKSLNFFSRKQEDSSVGNTDVPSGSTLGARQPVDMNKNINMRPTDGEFSRGEMGKTASMIKTLRKMTSDHVRSTNKGLMDRRYFKKYFKKTLG